MSVPDDGRIRCTARFELEDGGVEEATNVIDGVSFVTWQDGGVELSGLPGLFRVTGAPGGDLTVTSVGAAELPPWSTAVRAGDAVGLDVSASLSGPGVRRQTAQCVGRSQIAPHEGAAGSCGEACGELTVIGVDGRLHALSCGPCTLSDDCLGPFAQACGVDCSMGSNWSVARWRLRSIALRLGGREYTKDLGWGTLRSPAPDSGIVAFTFPFDPRSGSMGSGSATIDGGLLFVEGRGSTSLSYGSLTYGSASMTCRGGATFSYQR